jgi:hypothetical protein
MKRARSTHKQPSARRGVRLFVETFVLMRKIRFCRIPGPRDRNDIDAVKVILVPLRHEGQIAVVCGEERTGYGFDLPVLPGDEHNRVAIERLFDGGSHPNGIGKAEARIDGQP